MSLEYNTKLYTIISFCTKLLFPLAQPVLYCRLCLASSPVNRSDLWPHLRKVGQTQVPGL